MEPEEPRDDQFVNAVKAAELLRISYKTMLRWIKAGRVRAFEKRYDYENAEFLIPVEEVERLRAALSLSQRELVTRLLKVELDVQDMARRLLRVEIELGTVRKELAEIWEQGATHQPPSAAPGEGQAPKAEEIATMGPIPRQWQADTPPIIQAEDIPAGSVRLITFLRDHGVATTTGLDHLAKARIEPLLIDRGAKDKSKERWLTQEQQASLIVFWDSAGKAYTPCPDCPHYVITAGAGEDETEIVDEPEREGREGEQQPPSERGE